MPRAVGIENLEKQAQACQHFVPIGAGDGPGALFGVKLRIQDCPYCLRREMNYWRSRARAAEGTLRANLEALKRIEEAAS